jgi:hypothetical protein
MQTVVLLLTATQTGTQQTRAGGRSAQRGGGAVPLARPAPRRVLGCGRLWLWQRQQRCARQQGQARQQGLVVVVVVVSWRRLRLGLRLLLVGRL